MKRFSLRPFLTALIPLVLITSGAFAESLYPLGLRDARLSSKDSAEARIGISYAKDLHNLFQAADLNRKVLEIPSIDLSLALAERVEFDLHYSFLYLEERGQAAKWGSGDMVLGFKVGLLRESVEHPAFAVRFASKLPNADENDDFGTDQTDVHLQVLAAKTYDRFSGFVNLGLAILGDPRAGSKGQDDLLLYGIGVTIPTRADGPKLLFSLEGQEFGEEINRRGIFIAGIKDRIGDLFWDLGLGLGYASRSEDWSIRGGITVPFSVSNY